MHGDLFGFTVRFIRLMKYYNCARVNIYPGAERDRNAGTRHQRHRVCRVNEPSDELTNRRPFV